jgi:hypothetical protein
VGITESRAHRAIHIDDSICSLYDSLHLWRDNNGLEADLIFESGGSLQMVEIKSGRTLTSDYVRAGKKAASFAKEQALMPWLIYGGEDSYERNGVRVVGWKQLAEIGQGNPP